MVCAHVGHPGWMSSLTMAKAQAIAHSRARACGRGEVGHTAEGMIPTADDGSSCVNQGPRTRDPDSMSG